MVSVPVIMSSHNVCSIATGGNLWRSKHSTKNIFPYSSSWESKASHHKREIQIKYNLLKFQQQNLNHLTECVDRGPTHQERNKKYVMNATSKTSFDFEPHASNPKNTLDSIKKFLIILYNFCYPYAMVARSLSIFSASLLAVETLSDISPLFFIRMLQAQVPFFFMDFFISGVNQLFDIEIDKINKPYLPLASGQLSVTGGVIITTSSLFMSLGTCWIIGSWPLFWNIVLRALLWSAYSIDAPMLRWKKHPLLSTMVTFLSLAIISPITYFLHIQTFVLKRPALLPRSMFLFIVFMGFYTISLAFFKDIPDIEGDKKFGIDSFSAKLGQKRVFWICVSLIEMAFGVGLLGGATSSYFWIKIVTGLGYIILASVLWCQAKSIDLESQASIRSFYMLMWKLLYGAYFLIPLIR